MTGSPSPPLTAPGARVTRRVRTPWVTGTVVAVLILIVLAFAVHRLIVDVPSLLSGAPPEQPYDARYVSHPWLTYLHIVPGALYLLGAALQVTFRFRRRHYPLHRRLGRTVLALGLLQGTMAVVLGVVMPFGGPAELWATVLFGAWFVACLVLAFRAIRGGDVAQHRRWMIRAFAVGVAVGTIRIWIPLLQIVGGVNLAASFGPAFWISFSSHVVAAELYLRARPLPPEALAKVEDHQPETIGNKEGNRAR